MKWEEYELEVLEYLQSKFYDCLIYRDVKLNGKLSKTNRQIDILIEKQIGDINIRLIVECKRWKKKLDVANVGEFIDKLRDIGASRGMMIARNGYTKAAYERAMSENELQLHILDFENKPEFQGFWGIPYWGHCGAIISAPTGWIVDSDLTDEQRKNFGQCFLYPMGLTAKEAMNKLEFMYFNIIPIPTDIDELVEEQNKTVLERDPKSDIHVGLDNLECGPILMRQIYYARDNYTEFTAFFDTERFHAYCVIASLNSKVEVNLARLRYVVNNIKFVILEGINPEDSHKDWENFVNFSFGELPETNNK